MSSFAVSVRTVFFECPLRWFRRPAGVSLSRWSSSSALRTRSASAFFSSSKSPSLLKTSFGSRPSRSWSRVSFLIAISALHRRHYGPAHKIPDSPDACGSCGGLRRLPALDNCAHHALSTKRRQTGIVMDVHPVLRGITEASQLQLPRTEPDEQPIESSQLERAPPAGAATPGATTV